MGKTHRLALDSLYPGKRAETIRTWGRDRLGVLARVLPLVDRAEAYLLGTGLPSFWVLHLGGMRLTLGLSGWTANDWTSTNSLNQIVPPAEANKLTSSGDPGQRSSASSTTLTFAQIQQRTGAAHAYVAVGLNRLAGLGQLIHDLPAGLYRWRQILPVALSLDQLGPENPETVAAPRSLVAGPPRLRDPGTIAVLTAYGCWKAKSKARTMPCCSTPTAGCCAASATARTISRTSCGVARAAICKRCATRRLAARRRRRWSDGLSRCGIETADLCGTASQTSGLVRRGDAARSAAARVAAARRNGNPGKNFLAAACAVIRRHPKRRIAQHTAAASIRHCSSARGLPADSAHEMVDEAKAVGQALWSNPGLAAAI